MERSKVRPHISWSGPCFDREEYAYLLAMILRIHSAVLIANNETERNRLLPPSILTTKNMALIALLFAYYRERMGENGVHTTEGMLKLIKAATGDSVADWRRGNEVAVRRAEAEILEFVETPGNIGFSAFG